MTRKGLGAPRGWELLLFRLCMRAYPRDLREANADGMCQTFEDRRLALGHSGARGLADTLLECGDVLKEGVRARCAKRLGFRWASGGSHGEGRGHMGDWLSGFVSVLRILGRRPAWTFLVIATLGAGIGATTAVYSVVDGVALRSLPYESPDELIRIGGVREGRPGLSSVSGPNFRDLEGAATRLSQVAASTPSSIAVGGRDGPADQVRGGYVSGQFFTLLGVRPAQGRVLIPADDQPGASPVAVLSHALWRERFDSTAVGTVITLDGQQVTVVGVMPADFHPPEGVHLGATLLWLPLVHAPLPVDERRLSFLDVLGRVGPGATPEQVEAELRTVGNGLRETHHLSGRQFSTFTSAPLAAETIGDAGSTLVLLFGAVALLLLVACTNVANLIFVRTLDRWEEIAVRVSLGAGRGRIVRDLVMESLVLALAGGFLGVALAYLGVTALKRTAPIDLPRLQEVAVDGRVLVFAVGVSGLVGLLVGLSPALRAVRGGALAGVAGVGRGASGPRWQGRARDGLVVAQVALGLILLIGSGLLINSLVHLHRVDVGFDTGGLYVLSVRLESDEAGGPGASTHVHDALLAAVADVPGVTDASVTTGAPFTSGGWTVYVQPEGRDLPEEELMSAHIGLHQVSGGHLSMLGVTMVAGREILATDGPGGEPVVVISEGLARRYWPDGDAVGARLVVGGDGTFTKRTVVGVAASVLYAGPASGDEQHVYLPYRQFAPGAVDLMIRVQRMNAEIVSSLRSAVHQAAPGASIRRFEAVDAAMARYFVEPGFYAWLLTAFAAIALLLAVGGLYGTLSFAVSRRRREFGIRLALGAAGSELERLVVARGLFITALGLVLGVVGSVAASRVLGGYLFQVSGTDAPTYGAVCLAFLTVAALASWMPARKAGSTEPVESLRVS